MITFGKFQKSVHNQQVFISTTRGYGSFNQFAGLKIVLFQQATLRAT